LSDRLARAADESRERREVRLRIAGQRNERDVLTARPLERTAAHQPERVPEQNRRQQHRRCVRARTHRVVAVPRIEPAQIELLTDQHFECVLERPRQQLRLQIHRQ
jgi:hypothetical protein